MRILLIEDDAEISAYVEMELRHEGYAVSAAYDGVSGLQAALDADFDVILLDMMLPGLNGLEVLRRLRAQGSRLPVLLLTARSEVEDKVLGLDTGANDYLTKPFSTAELLARIRAMTRVQTPQADSVLRFGNVSLDQASFVLSSPAGSYRLANKEFQMMEMLLRHPRQRIPTERFLESVWGYDTSAEVNVVWVYISYLRKKLAALQATVEIRAVRGVGYCLEELP